MELFLGALAWLAGAAQFALTFQQVRKANSNERIPLFFGRPRSHPREIYVYRAIAILLLIISVFVWSDLIGVWSVLLIFVGSIPALVLNLRHNRQARSD